MIGGAGTLTLGLAAVMLLALIAYALLGGADYGGGVWDMFATGDRRERQRTLIADAIGPVWEANHVWLILVVVLLFTVFPPAFARLTTVLHIPLALMLIGIVMRGSAFTFRTYDDRRSIAQRRWGRLFAIASIITPVLLGICIGAIASGSAGESWRHLDRLRGCGDAAGAECVAAREAASFASVYVESWLTPFALGTGVFALAMFAFLAAVYLTVEAPDDDLRRDFRSRAFAAAGVMGAVAALLPFLASADDSVMRQRLLGSWWSVPLIFATAAFLAVAIRCLMREKYRLARIGAAGVVSLLLIGWAAAQFPHIIPPDLTIAQAAAPQSTQRLIAIALAFGAIVLLPSLAYLLRVFKGKQPAFARIEE